MQNIVVVDNAKKAKFDVVNAEIVSAKNYLLDSNYSKINNIRIYNLCKSCKYQSTGYYVSLLAQARGHKVLPNITTLQDLNSRPIIKLCNENLEADIQRSLSKIKSEEFILSVYFGHNIAKQHETLSKKIFDLFRVPLLRIKFVYVDQKWVLRNITMISLNEVPEPHLPYLNEFATQYFSKKRVCEPKKHHTIYDLAILIKPNDEEPPSDKKAIQNFITAGESLGFCVDLITKDDFNRLPEYDALFIRETTAVNHHTYRFARRALAEGLVVIDDPESIIKCTNKVYLAELLARTRISTPKTLVVCEDNQSLIEPLLGFPCVLKKPDDSCSRGVIKVENKEMLKDVLNQYFKTSELIIAQEFLPTEFDWRIGILNKQPLFAIKYFMAKNHWQIYDWESKERYGDHESVDIPNVPDVIIKTALKAANLIGNGFYGVDIKQIKDRAYVIEINDNPSIDAGVEDARLKNDLYLTIMKTFLTRLQEKKQTHHES
ncbi:MAG: RimK family protein [Gammaproteobacteria bacterium]|nr:RimK family protein [Gammaproteobacteria bacterium]